MPKEERMILVIDTEAMLSTEEKEELEEYLSEDKIESEPDAW